MSTFEQKVLPLFEQHRTEWLGKARAAARFLGALGGPVTIDDVRLLVGAPPAGVDPRVNGAVFRKEAWQACGYIKSKRRDCHNRPIAQFRLKTV